MLLIIAVNLVWNEQSTHMVIGKDTSFENSGGGKV